MKTTRLMIPAAVALCFGLTSCVDYWEKRQAVKADANGPSDLISEANGRDYDRYGIPPGPDDTSWQEVEGHRAPASNQADIPKAQLSDSDDEVISPFPPHRRINVAGFKSGDLAKDPKSGEVFRIP